MPKFWRYMTPSVRRQWDEVERAPRKLSANPEVIKRILNQRGRCELPAQLQFSDVSYKEVKSISREMMRTL